MNCPSCGEPNRAGARFCGGCGQPLAPRCPACGVEVEPGRRFCDACGASLSTRPAEAAVARKVVTIVFADLVGSTALHERLDAESARLFMERYYGAMRGAVESFGGTVTQLLGDGVKAVFGAPRVAEDDAIRAVRAAVEMQRAFRELAQQQRSLVGKTGLRVAVNTGEVVANDETEIIGDPVNVAARLQEEGRDGDVVIGEPTRRLVADLVTLTPLGSFALKGRAEAVAAYRVVSLDRPAGAPAIAFVGRDDELARITAVYDAAIAAPGARLAVLLGSPGLGKSRLLAEFARRLGERARVLTAQCNAAGGASFAPLADALRAHLHLEDASGDALRAPLAAIATGEEAERARIAAGIAALLAGTPASPEETFFVVRRLLAALAAERPLVLVIDDLQWAEPLLLDLTEHLVQWGAGVPLLVLAAARPELRDTRSSLASPGGVVSDVVTLAGLDAGAATRLAANVIGAADLPAAVAAKVLASSEGNPLFVAELVRMLVHDGALKREGDRWTTGVQLAGIEMPPTIQALLAARIERLRPEDRAVLERAAVVGRHFSRAAVAHLLPREIGDLDARLESLRRSELIEPDTGWFLGEPVLRFHHLLIRDAAYRRLLKHTRAELHARFADWVEARVGEAVEHDETIGWHLEQAHQHLAELGPIDAQGRVLGERAARHLAAAGRRALARDDVPLAASLLGRSLARIDADDPARADLALDWCESLLSAGDVGQAAAAIDELGRFSEASDRLRAWHTCFAGQLAALTDPQALRTTADAVEAAAHTLASIGDAAGEAKAHSVHAAALARLGKVGACEAALDRALAAARRVDDRRRSNAVLAGAPLAALWGPSPVTRASGRCLDVVRVLRITQGAPAVEAIALQCQGVLEALRGRTEAAQRMIASSRQMVEELGITHRLLDADVFAGRIELLEGNAVTAERCLRSAYDGLRGLGLGIDAARAAALLARALLARGRAADAEALSHASEALAGDDLQAAIAWRGVRAEALARRGEHAAAVELARAAVEIAAATDALLDHADARLALAAALRAAGRSAEADAEEARAIELWDAKGATLLAERARSSEGRTAELERAPEDRIESARSIPCRVRPNAATAHAARLEAAIAARDADALPALLADGMVVVHHPTGAEHGREGVLFSLRNLVSDRNQLRSEPLATLGDSLALCRWSVSGSGSTLIRDLGAHERDQLVLFEVDAQGRRAQTELFAVDRLGDAITRLYELYVGLFPDGPERERAAATARSAAAYLGPWDPDLYAAAFAPAIEVVDHRILGTWSTRGVEAAVENIRSWLLLTDDAALREGDILRLQSDALLAYRTFFGTDRASGGSFEREFLQLWVFGSDGLFTRIEYFDADREAEALARFDELTAEAPAARFANAAARVMEQTRRAMESGDWDGLVALYAPEHVFDDRRPLVRTRVEGEAFFAELRRLFPAIRESSIHLVATRGDRLALDSHVLTTVSGDGGPAEFEMFNVVEVDAAGRRVALVTFDLADLDAAYAELDARYAAESPAYAHLRGFGQATADRAWDAVAAYLAPGFVMYDHRLLGWETLRGGEAWIQTLRSLVDLAPDVRLRIDHIRHAGRRSLVASTWVGTRDGGAFEDPKIVVSELDGAGRFRRMDQYDLDQLDAALARYDALTSEPPAPRVENAATRAADRINAAWAARDWRRVAEAFPAGFRCSDRKRMTQLELDRDQYLEWMRPLFEMSSSRLEQVVLATRGDRLSLARLHVEVADHNIGPSEIESLAVLEVDEHGERVATVRFEPDDIDAAYAELDARYAAGEAAAHARVAAGMAAFFRAIAARDWDTMSSLLGPDLVVSDHRPLGWETLHGPAMYVESLRSLADLAPDVRLRVDHMRLSHRSALVVDTWMGTREGGAFEAPRAVVAGFDPGGRIRSIDLHDPEQLDAALALFAELAPPKRSAQRAVGERSPSGSLRIPPNAASRASDRLQEAFEARNWNAFGALCAPAFVLDDRRPSVLLTGDRDVLVASGQFIASQGASNARTLLATAGDRLALERHLLTGAADAPDAELEVLVLTEVDAEGCIVAHVNFDPDDRRAASAELFERYARSDAAGKLPAGGLEFRRALRDRDLDRARAALPDDFFFHDHRRTGAGRLGSADEYVAFVAALFEQSPDVLIESLYIVAAEAHGILDVGHLLGTRDGGEFESPFVRILLHRGDRPLGGELFEIEDMDVARARFEELRPDPMRIPASAATRAGDRISEAIVARDWDAVAALASEEFRFEDRSRWAQVGGDVEVWIASVTFLVSESRARAERELLGTVGDRIALYHTAWSSAADATRFELDRLRIIEVDAEGKLRAFILFDLDDRRAAFTEAQARFAAGEAAAIGGQAPIAALVRAIGRHDWESLRGVLARDAVISDRRALAVMGEFDRERWIDSLRTLADLAPDMNWELSRILAWNRHGRVAAARLFGTRDGGPFENAFVAVLLTRGDHVERYEFFDVGDAGRALARFEELSAERA